MALFDLKKLCVSRIKHLGNKGISTMKKNVQLFAKSTLTLSILVFTSLAHANVSLEQQVAQLQQQVQALQELVQQQQKANDQKFNEQNLPHPFYSIRQRAVLNLSSTAMCART